MYTLPSFPTLLMRQRVSPKTAARNVQGRRLTVEGLGNIAGSRSGLLHGGRL